MKGSRDVYNAVEWIKDIVVARSTGAWPDENEYRRLRGDLMARPDIKRRLPDIVTRSRSLDEVWAFIKPRYGTYAERREYLREEFDPLLTYLEGSEPGDDVIEQSITVADAGAVRAIWAKALDRIDADPEGAITAARTLVETVCKHILTEDRVEYDDDADLPKLYRAVADHLRLSPAQHTEDVVKRILGGAQSVVEGLGTLRNRWSDSHAQAPRAVRPAPRHARLAVNMAGTLAAFLLDTWRDRALPGAQGKDSDVRIDIHVDLTGLAGSG